MMRRARLLAVVLAFSLAFRAGAADRQRIAVLNTSLTSLVTLASCYTQKHLHSFRDAARCLGFGAIAGAGFYQAKRLAARGDITQGWLVANASTSLVENTTAGEHPLGRVGYTLGPLRLRVATPFDRTRESRIDLDASLVEIGFFARAIQTADDFDIRDGMLAYETDRPIREDGVVFQGYTWGVFPGVWRRAAPHTRDHEVIHAIQSLQLDSAEPPAMTVDRQPRFFRVRFIRAGALNLADNLYAQQLDYNRRWAEIEAYRLTQDIPPVDVDE
jgi:hypothetical protein